MLGAYPIAMAPLAVAIGGEVLEPIEKALAPVWRVRVIVADVDWTARLTGTITIDREEGAAGIAEFDICLPPGVVRPMEWKGRTVTIDFIATQAGVTREARLFTGRIVDPSWARTERRLTCSCTDQLQQRGEAMEIAAIDTLIGGYWSADVFEALDGRSHWDYAQERLESIPSSLDCDVYGNLRVTSWYAQSPHFEFGAGTTVYDSLDVQLSDVTEETNTVAIEFGYRFPRLRQLNRSYSWVSPQTGGSTGIEGFCQWLSDSTELPDIQMVEEAVSGSGQVITGGSYFKQQPSGSGQYCDPPSFFRNDYPDLLLGFGISAGRRWVQSVTERYTFTVVAQSAVDAVGEVIERVSTSVDVESDQADEWESDDFSGGGTGHTDIREESRRIAAVQTLLNQASTTIIGAHRGTTISWQDPTSTVLDIDLVHTLSLADQDCSAVGKVRRLQHSLDLGSGLALTTISIASMQGGGTASDPLIVPAGSEREPQTSSIAFVSTQIGGRYSSGEYDDSRPNDFSGNYSNKDTGATEFTRQLKLTAPEVGEDVRDEDEVAIAATYQVAIPNDLLELT